MILLNNNIHTKVIDKLDELTELMNIFKGPDNVYTQAIELLDSMYKLNKLLD